MKQSNLDTSHGHDPRIHRTETGKRKAAGLQPSRSILECIPGVARTREAASSLVLAGRKRTDGHRQAAFREPSQSFVSLREPRTSGCTRQCSRAFREEIDLRIANV